VVYHRRFMNNKLITYFVVFPTIFELRKFMLQKFIYWILDTNTILLSTLELDSRSSTNTSHKSLSVLGVDSKLCTYVNPAALQKFMLIDSEQPFQELNQRRKCYSFIKQFSFKVLF